MLVRVDMDADVVVMTSASDQRRVSAWFNPSRNFCRCMRARGAFDEADSFPAT